MNDIPDEMRKKVIADLEDLHRFEWIRKDVCIVVHDQIEYVKECMHKLMHHTYDADIWVWDNGSGLEVREYLEEMASFGWIYLHRSETNEGFIGPANSLFSMGTAPYVILLNSDTEVSAGWDQAMISHLQLRPGTGVVGYQGGLLDENGVGGKVGFGCGYDVDYVAGWCFAVRRSDIVGPLFDSENLSFAYGEDSDLSLRLRERGLVPYALHLELVMHHGNKTVLEVARDPEMAARMRQTFDANHEYIKTRWAKYLAQDRVGLHA